MQCDLQAVSIDPTKPSIKKGGQVTVVANIKNNGPDPIAKGEAKIHCTINGRFLYKPHSFKSDRWKLEAIKSKSFVKTLLSIPGNYELFCTNSKPIEVNEPGFPGFQFAVRGKAPGTADITLASTLSATATSSETDGSNNSARTELIVTK